MNGTVLPVLLVLLIVGCELGAPWPGNTERMKSATH